MYLITYVDRVNIATAASEIRRDLGLSNTRLGLALSAFGYPYLLFQIFGGWIGDRVGPRRTLFLCGVIWAAALDVTDPEPLPASDPLLTLENCLVVPHIASASGATRGKMAEMAAANLLAGVRGERLPTPINPEVYESPAETR